MTEQQLKKMVDKYQKEKQIKEFGRRDMEEFTQENETVLGFSCEEVDKTDDRYMIAQVGGKVILSQNDNTMNNSRGLSFEINSPTPEHLTKWVNIVFDYEAIPDNMEKFTSKEHFLQAVWLNYLDAQNVKQGTLKWER